jgi:hypothetical protein
MALRISTPPRARSGHRRVRRVDDVARTAAEDRVVLVLSRRGGARVAPVLVAGEATSEVPAARTLTKIARNRPHGAERGRSDALAGLGECTESLADARVARQLREANGAANAEATVVPPGELARVGDACEVNETSGRARSSRMHTIRSVPPPSGAEPERCELPLGVVLGRCPGVRELVDITGDWGLGTGGLGRPIYVSQRALLSDSHRFALSRTPLFACELA